jgi:hypothetical protein
MDYLKYKEHIAINSRKKKQVVDPYFNQHRAYAEIAEIEKISPHDMHVIIKKEEVRRQKIAQEQEEISSTAYGLVMVRAMLKFSSIKLKEPEVIGMFIEYCKLNHT